MLKFYNEKNPYSWKNVTKKVVEYLINYYSSGSITLEVKKGLQIYSEIASISGPEAALRSVNKLYSGMASRLKNQRFLKSKELLMEHLEASDKVVRTIKE